jgi:hypothetical protein
LAGGDPASGTRSWSVGSSPPGTATFAPRVSVLFQAGSAHAAWIVPALARCNVLVVVYGVAVRHLAAQLVGGQRRGSTKAEVLGLHRAAGTVTAVVPQDPVGSPMTTTRPVVEATPEGYDELVEFVNTHPILRAWAIEGTGGHERQALSVLLTARRSAVNASTEAQLQLFSLVIAAPEPLRANSGQVTTRHRLNR